MHGEELSSVKQSTASVPTPQSLSIKRLVPVPLLIIVAGGLYLTNKTLFASVAFFLALFVGSILFALRTQRRPLQKQTVTGSTSTLSTVTVKATPVGTSHKLPQIVVTLIRQPLSQSISTSAQPSKRPFLVSLSPQKKGELNYLASFPLTVRRRFTATRETSGSSS
jgi:uncharacterized protein (DUF58 family)